MIKRSATMKNLMTLSLILFCLDVHASTIYNSDGSFTTIHGDTAYNSDGSFSTMHGNTVYNSDGSFETITP